LSADRVVVPRRVFFEPALRAVLTPPAVCVRLRFNGERVLFFG
jgi:hypothetical protein